MGGVLTLLQQVNARRVAFSDARRRYEERLAPDFSPFAFIQPDEMQLSRILAWLLNPVGSHGQSGRFLYLFVKQFTHTCPDRAWSLETCAGMDTRTEVFVNGSGRIDILVRSSRHTLAIENKIDAEDQDRQLERYGAYLDSLKQAETYLIYLTPEASEPSLKSIGEEDRTRRSQANQFHLFSYRQDVIDWLQACKASCRADRVSVFIDEFTRFLNKRFGGSSDMTMQDDLAHEITRSADMVTSAMQIILAEDNLRRKLIEMLASQLRSAATTKGWGFDANGGSHKYSSFTIVLPGDYTLVFEFQSANFNGLIYGLTKAVNDEASIAAIQCNIGPGLRNAVWAWYRRSSPLDPVFPVEADWGAVETPWAAIVRGGLAEAVLGVADRFCQALANCQPSPPTLPSGIPTTP